MTQGVVLAHDYATQRGGAERVALVMAEAFPSSPMYTTLYDPEGTYPEFAEVDLRPSALNRVGVLRRNHRLALPLLAPVVSRERIEADVLLASSSGWAHGYRGAGRTVVYCYIPARWLYQRDRYLAGRGSTFGDQARHALAGTSLRMLTPALKRWDKKAARRADVYLTCSSVARDAVREVYDIDAEVLSPPPAMLPAGDEAPVPGVQPGFLLCVARLLPYKNVDIAIRAAQRLGGPELVVVGDGPDKARLEEIVDQDRSSKVHLLGRVRDDELRWIYRNASALVGASYEDFGLSPLEAGSFGHPSVVLRAGGYLDSVVEGVTGEFFDTLDPEDVADAMGRTLAQKWDPQTLAKHAAKFGVDRFVDRLHEVVAEQKELAGR